MTGEARPEATEGIAGTFRVAASNPGIARAVVAYGGWTFADWATWIAILVYAFQLGGPTAAGILAVGVLVPAAVLGPIVAAVGDRIPRERLLLASYAGQAVTMGLVGLAMEAAAPVGLVGVLGAVMVVAISVGRPAHNSLLPQLARSPEELTAANVASGTIQNVAILVAPGVAGLILAGWGPSAAFAVTATVAAASAILVAGIRSESATVARRPAPLAPSTTPVPPPGRDRTGLRATLGLLRLHGSARAIVLMIAAGSVIEGAIDLIAVVLALDVLGLGRGGVGVLGSAVGAGGLIGAAAAAGLVGRTRLGRPFLGGLLVWSLPLVVVGVLPEPLVAVLAFVVAGSGRSLMDVAGRTLLQRVAPEAGLSAIFGALEGLHVLMLAVGSILVPVLIAIAGPRPALVLTGLWLPIAVVIASRAVRLADDHAIVHVRELRRLRALPMFAPLSPPTIERLAASLVAVEAPAGSIVVEQGTGGDRFYLIDRGTAEVTIDGRAVRTLGPGDGFGEIALIRDVPRTASVLALEALTLLTLERRTFLEAVTGHPEARLTTDRLVAARIGTAPESSAGMLRPEAPDPTSGVPVSGDGG